jgi:hypothetical protein
LGNNSSIIGNSRGISFEAPSNVMAQAMELEYMKIWRRGGVIELEAVMTTSGRCSLNESVAEGHKMAGLGGLKGSSSHFFCSHRSRLPLDAKMHGKYLTNG